MRSLPNRAKKINASYVKGGPLSHMTEAAIGFFSAYHGGRMNGEINARALEMKKTKPIEELFAAAGGPVKFLLAAIAS